MTFRSQYCEDKDGTMLFLVMEDNNKKEQMRIPIYLSKEAAKKLPTLETSLKQLPKMFEMMYTSGKKLEKINFISESIQLE